MNGLLISIIAAVVLGFGSVFAFGGVMSEVYWIGEFFLKSLKMIIVPLIFFSMVSGIASLGDVRKLGRLGGRTVLYYALTTAIAVGIGALLVNLMQPGAGLSVGELAVPEKVAAKEDIGLSDIVLGFVSDNIVGSMAEMQMLPIIVFSLVFGGVLTTLGDKGKPVIDVCEGGNEAMMKIVHLLMYLAPLGIFALIAGRFGQAMGVPVGEAIGALQDGVAVKDAGVGGFMDELAAVGKYMLTVIVALGVHATIVLPLILWITTKRNPLSYLKGMLQALVTAFSTASSAATLPITIESAIENNKVDERAAEFVLPLGATVNMDGTALYEAVAVIFIAQALGVDLTVGDQLMIVLTATLAAIGAAGIPEAGLVTMIIVLRAVDLPLEGVELILAVDWLLDRFRTTVNVWGDSVGAAVVEKYARPPDEAAAPS